MLNTARRSGGPGYTQFGRKHLSQRGGSITMESTGNELSDVVPDAHPWRRWIARFYDYALMLIILETLNEYYLSLQFPGLDLTTIVRIIPPVIWVFVESLLISALGTTPGKWLFKIRIATELGERPAQLQSLQRSFNVWLRGLALGVPLVSIFAMIIAYSKLQKRGHTSWDANAGTIVHIEKLAPVQYAFIILIGLLFAWLIYW